VGGGGAGFTGDGLKGAEKGRGALAGCTGPEDLTGRATDWGPSANARLGTGARFSVLPTSFTLGVNRAVNLFFRLSGTAKRPLVTGARAVGTTSTPSSNLGWSGVTRLAPTRSRNCCVGLCSERASASTTTGYSSPATDSS